MRLTLRTLLAYLDDTLEPAQAKVIGQKVAESEQAREMMERIKQVVRMRRLTTPPTTGPGNRIDANTIAEYLDSVVTPEQAGEVEQIALASDVHLAEIAACHQILTLVLGQPALVPAPAKQRMYGLVKGPESIPFRRPTKDSGTLELHGDAKDADEALRLGLPLMVGKGKWLGTLGLIGGSFVAAGLLVFALFQALKPIDNPRPEPREQQIVRNDVKEPEPKKDEWPVIPPPKFDDYTPSPPAVPAKSGKFEVIETPKQKEKTEAPLKPVEKEPVPKEKQKEKDGEPLPPPPPPMATTVLPEDRFAAPDNRPLILGKIAAAGGKNPFVVLTHLHDKASAAKAKAPVWQKVKAPLECKAGHDYMCLPGWSGQMVMNRGVTLALRGNLPEILPSPPVLESTVQLHGSQLYDLDFTLDRGRIVLTGTREDRPALVRLRFANPTQPDQNDYIDLALQGKGSSLLVDRWSYFPPSEKFYKDPKDPNRVGPAANMALVVLKGHVLVRMGGLSYNLSAPPGPAVILWDSMGKGLGSPQAIKELPSFVEEVPPLPAGLDEKIVAQVKKVREQALQARNTLNDVLATKDVDVAIAEALEASDAPSRILAVRCQAALDDLAALIDSLTHDKNTDMRQAALRSLQGWIPLKRDNEYLVYDQLRNRYSAAEAESALSLLHGLPKVDVHTLDLLVEYLNSNALVLRELAYLNLIALVPDGRSIPYDPTFEAPRRIAAQQAWHEAIRKASKTPTPMK